MLISTQISFRKLQTENVPLLQQWLTQPHVHAWYDKDKETTLEAVTKRYDPKIVGKEPTACYLVLYKTQPVGYIQTYIVTDWPKFGNYVEYDEHTASIDVFIGELAFLGKGLGSMLLIKFLKEIVFANPAITTCIIGPEPANKRAIKAYEKAGFRYKKTVQVGSEPDPTYVMEIKKEELSQ